ncbi:hypothetical protein QVN42_02120 [Yersinia nurmii]|uniref:JHE-like toxin PirA n=1 Tax=Yersinia nurmii TaxID=685706 RepID=A0AAW7JTC5_9GAMM|nr:hypothetical protein [Yersinia nurmii]MDN0086198.1 hypothetical protein [Yersinia nurmii]CNE45801.1 Uncharacterised protein [Yersinia nurmii]
MNKVTITINTESNTVEVENPTEIYKTETAALISAPFRARVAAEVAPNSSTEVFYQSTPIIPESRRNIIITNDGAANLITAEYYWSHSFTSQWFLYTSVEVSVGESKLLQSPSNSLYYSKVVLVNKTSRKAYVTAEEK